jgi:hypothetical protein
MYLLLRAQAADFFNDLFHEPRHNNREFSVQRQVAFLFENSDPCIPLMRVMRANQTSDAVFQLRDHFAAAVVGGRVC